MWEDNIKMDITDASRESVNWIEVAQDLSVTCEQFLEQLSYTTCQERYFTVEFS
jgi:hypothetical protein